MPTTGLPLGIDQKAAFPPAQPVTLDPGDILLVGTDGIWEARPLEGEMFESHRLRQVLATWPNKSAREIHHVVMEKAERFFMGAQRSDGMALMVIKVLANG